jgi:hypothetical protein
MEGALKSLSFSTTISAGRDRRGRWLAVGVAVMALVVYAATLAPGLTFEHFGTDGGDLIAAARTLGVPHPTGYPAYSLLAWLFTYLPVGTMAYRVNLLSAVCAAGAVGLLCHSTQLLLPAGRHILALSAATALMLAFSPLFWSQAVISEVYALLALLAALVLWLLVRWRKGGGDGVLWLAAFVLGLGLGNHLTLAFVAPAALVLLWAGGVTQRSRWLRARTLLPAIGLFILGLGVYVYLPLAAIRRPPVNWGNPQTWDGFVWVVTAKQYQAFAFGLNSGEIAGRLSAWAGLVGQQLGWWGLAIALAGAWWWWQRDRSFVLFSLIWMLLVSVYAFFYDTFDSHVYLVPVLLLLALWWGEGARYLLHLARRLGPAGQRVVLVAIVALPLVSLVMNWRAMDLSDEGLAHAYMYQVLDGVDADGLVVVRGDGPTFTLWYGLYAEGRRPDVAVVSGPLLAYIWYRDQVRHLYPDLILDEPGDAAVTTDDLVRDLMAQNIGRRPIYATDPAEAWNVWFEFVEEADVPIYRVRSWPDGAGGP